MISAVIVAAGSSRRMGFDKLGASVAGKPLLAHTIEAFENSDQVSEIVVVTARERFAALEQWAAIYRWRNFRPPVAGGQERFHSVMGGLEATDQAFPLIAVHDGARPLVTPALIHDCAVVAAEMGAACVAAPVTETLKRRDPATGFTRDPVDRSELWGMQTPQIFRREILLQAYAALDGRSVTDEASAVELAGKPVKLVENPEWNVKVTYPRDLPLVEWVLADRSASRQA